MYVSAARMGCTYEWACSHFEWGRGDVEASYWSDTSHGLSALNYHWLFLHKSILFILWHLLYSALWPYMSTIQYITDVAINRPTTGLLSFFSIRNLLKLTIWFGLFLSLFEWVLVWDPYSDPTLYLFSWDAKCLFNLRVLNPMLLLL